MEQKLIEMAKQYIAIEAGPDTEIISDKLFTLAAQVSHPRTRAGRAIVAYVRAEEKTGYSLSANEEYDAMCLAVKSA
jgi:hypothetical protein